MFITLDIVFLQNSIFKNLFRMFAFINADYEWICRKTQRSELLRSVCVQSTQNNNWFLHFKANESINQNKRYKYLSHYANRNNINNNGIERYSTTHGKKIADN